MKKLISIILIICVLFTTAYAAGTPSPTLIDYYFFKPNVGFQFLTHIPTNFHLSYTEIFAMLHSLANEIDWNECQIDEAFILFLNSYLTNIKFSSPTKYNINDTVYIIIITQHHQLYLRNGEVSIDGAVTIDFTDVPAETVIIFIVSNHNMDS